MGGEERELFHYIRESSQVVLFLNYVRDLFSLQKKAAFFTRTRWVGLSFTAKRLFQPLIASG